MIQDLRYLLEYCRDLSKNKKLLFKLCKIRGKDGKYKYPALDWVYPFTVYAIENNKGYPKVNSTLNKWYAKVNDIPATQ